MKKPLKPSQPSNPTKPPEPETYVWIDRQKTIKGFYFVYETGHDYYDDTKLNFAKLSEEDLAKINDEVTKFKANIDLNNIKDFYVDLKDSFIRYKEKIPNPKLVSQTVSWNRKMEDYEKKLNNFNNLMKQYKIDLKKYNEENLEYQLKVAEEHLASLKNKVKNKQ